jgi:hypothetical protein
VASTAQTTGTASAGATRTVDLPIERVWAGLVDHEAMSAWAPGLRVTLDREGTEERNGVGAVRRIAVPGPAPAIVEEVVTCDPPRTLGYRAVSAVPFRDYGGTVTLHELDARTEITWTLSARPRVAAEKPVLALVARVLLGRFVASVRRAA